MKEAELIKLTLYAFAVLGKQLPKSFVLKLDEENVVCFFKYEDGHLFGYGGKPVGFYFEKEHRYELRSSYVGHELISWKGEDLDETLEELSFQK